MTGAGGFLGRRIAARLAEAGFGIRTMTRHPRADWPGDVRLPGLEAPLGDFRAGLRDATHVVHCAALNTDAGPVNEAGLMSSNAELPARLAEAAKAEGVQRVVFLSSTRAVVGAGESAIIDASTEARPACAYGRSKLAGEQAVLAALRHGGSQPLILRLPPAYGAGMRGNLASLMRLARLPVPLPLAGISGRRTLVAADAVGDAVLSLLTVALPSGRIYVAGDAFPVTIADIVGAFRQGFARSPWLFPVPVTVLRAGASLLGKAAIWDSLAATQICDSSALIAEGWTPCPDSRPGLAAAASAFRAV
ncbi:MAG: NAD-dependent epimerase/dehydratase family protein [Mesorhizobium sp.]|nr:NAD-dependent epimerase/dehydratase family protein [Mesorhizobium sp.]